MHRLHRREHCVLQRTEMRLARTGLLVVFDVFVDGDKICPRNFARGH